jgi:hypothetical protein
MWFLDSPLPDTEPLDAHLAWLCAQVADKSDGFAALHAADYELDCFCFVEVLQGQGGLSISPQVLATLGRLAVELNLDIYAGSKDE